MQHTNDLAFFLGAHDNRTQRADIGHDVFNPALGSIALVDGGYAVWAQRDGAIVHTGEHDSVAELRRRLTELADRWDMTGRPTAAGWTCAFTQTSRTRAPLMLPNQWTALARSS
jgi:hypothetical protein